MRNSRLGKAFGMDDYAFERKTTAEQVSETSNQSSSKLNQSLTSVGNSNEIGAQGASRRLALNATRVNVDHLGAESAKTMGRNNGRC